MIGRRQWLRFAVMIAASWAAIGLAYYAMMLFWGADSVKFQNMLHGLVSIAIVWVPVIIAVGLLDLLKQRRRDRFNDSERKTL